MAGRFTWDDEAIATGIHARSTAADVPQAASRFSWDDEVPLDPRMNQKGTSRVQELDPTTYRGKLWDRAKALGYTPEQFDTEIYPQTEAESMTPYERGTMGLTAGLRNTGLGVLQLGANVARSAGNAANSLMGTEPSAIDAYAQTAPEYWRNQIQKDEEAWERGGMSDFPSAGFHKFIGQTAPLAAVAGLYGAPTSFGASTAGGLGGGGLTALTAPTTAEDYWGEKVPATIEGMKWGGIFGMGAGGLSSMGSKYRASNVLSDTDPNAMKYGDELAARTGVRMTPGERSQDPAVLASINQARHAPGSGPIVREQDELGLGELDALLQRQAAAGRPVSEIYPQVQKIAQQRSVDMRTQRTATAKENFGAIDTYNQGHAVIEMPNTMAAIDDLIKRYEGLEGMEAASVLNTARQMRTLLDSKGGRYTGRDISERLKIWNPKGKNNLFGTQNYGAEAPLKNQVFSALMKDLDDAADMVTATGMQTNPLPELIRTARDAWKRDSTNIDAFEKGVFKRFLGQDLVSDLDDIASYNTMTPTDFHKKLQELDEVEMKAVYQFMEGNNPQALSQLQDAYLLRALDAAKSTKGGVDTGVIDPEEFLKAFGLSAARGEKRLQGAERMQALFPKDQFPELWDAIEVSQRKTSIPRADPRAEATSLNTGISTGYKGILNNLYQKLAGKSYLGTVASSTDPSKDMYNPGSLLEMLVQQRGQKGARAGIYASMLGGRDQTETPPITIPYRY